MGQFYFHDLSGPYTLHAHQTSFCHSLFSEKEKRLSPRLLGVQSAIREPSFLGSFLCPTDDQILRHLRGFKLFNRARLTYFFNNENNTRNHWPPNQPINPLPAPSDGSQTDNSQEESKFAHWKPGATTWGADYEAKIVEESSKFAVEHRHIIWWEPINIGHTRCHGHRRPTVWIGARILQFPDLAIRGILS